MIGEECHAGHLSSWSSTVAMGPQKGKPRVLEQDSQVASGFKSRRQRGRKAGHWSVRVGLIESSWQAHEIDEAGGPWHDAVEDERGG